jgi:hypothetical protein
LVDIRRDRIRKKLSGDRIKLGCTLLTEVIARKQVWIMLGAIVNGIVGSRIGIRLGCALTVTETTLTIVAIIALSLRLQSGGGSLCSYLCSYLGSGHARRAVPPEAAPMERQPTYITAFTRSSDSEHTRDTSTRRISKREKCLIMNLTDVIEDKVVCSSGEDTRVVVRDTFQHTLPAQRDNSQGTNKEAISHADSVFRKRTTCRKVAHTCSIHVMAALGINRIRKLCHTLLDTQGRVS